MGPCPKDSTSTISVACGAVCAHPILNPLRDGLTSSVARVVLLSMLHVLIVLRAIPTAAIIYCLPIVTHEPAVSVNAPQIWPIVSSNGN